MSSNSRCVVGLVRLVLSALLPHAGALAAEPPDPVVAEVKARDAELSAAHGRGDMVTYLKGLSQRYVYIDIGGRRVTASTLARRRSNDNLRIVTSESSEEEALRLADNVVLLRGLERSTSTYFGGLPRQGSTRWSALWVREDDNQWRLVSETATPVTSDGGLPFTRAPQATASVRLRQGRWTLGLPVPMELVLTAKGGDLVATLVGQDARFVFAPASATHYFALDRPFEIRFSRGGKTLELVTWGIVTPGKRVSPRN
jgi:ketosteroid isomerase-like protein